MKTIHKGRYLAEYGESSGKPLLVITKPKGGGVYLEGDDAANWAHHIHTALDKAEANTLCRALLQT